MCYSIKGKFIRKINKIINYYFLLFYFLFISSNQFMKVLPEMTDKIFIAKSEFESRYLLCC